MKAIKGFLAVASLAAIFSWAPASFAQGAAGPDYVCTLLTPKGVEIYTWSGQDISGDYGVISIECRFRK